MPASLKKRLNILAFYDFAACLVVQLMREVLIIWILNKGADYPFDIHAS